MKNGGLILWNAVAFCGMFKTSWQMGKLLLKDVSENHLQDQEFLLEQWLNITRFQHGTRHDFTNLARQFYQEYFLGVHSSIAGGKKERRHSDCRY